MALPWSYNGYTPPKNPGQAQQNSLARSLATNNAATVAPSPPKPSDMIYGVEQTDATNPNNTVYTPYQQAAPTASVDPNTHQPVPSPTTSSSSSSSSGAPSIDFSGDPILAQVRAMNAMNVANAEAAALASRKQAEITYGYDPNITYEDQATQQAAQQNQLSTLANLLFNHQQRGLNLDEALNKGNLFYSGERARQIGLEGRQYTVEQSQAQQNFQNLLANIANQLLQAKTDAQWREVEAEQAAYERQLQFNLANGIGGGGAPGGGGSPGGLENPNQFNTGLTADQLNAAAAAYAQGRSYNGSPYQPGQVMQEGHIEVRNGVPGIYIKYRTAGGDSTEWTPIG